MLTGVITRAPTVCDQKMAWGPGSMQWVDSAGPQRAWGCNAALNSVAGAPAFGLVVTKPGVHDAMPQLYVGGTAPGIGEKH